MISAEQQAAKKRISGQRNREDAEFARLIVIAFSRAGERIRKVSLQTLTFPHFLVSPFAACPFEKI